jgi:hypothetical protein
VRVNQSLMHCLNRAVLNGFHNNFVLIRNTRIFRGTWAGVGWFSLMLSLRRKIICQSRMYSTRTVCCRGKVGA